MWRDYGSAPDRQKARGSVWWRCSDDGDSRYDLYRRDEYDEFVVAAHAYDANKIDIGDVGRSVQILVWNGRGIQELAGGRRIFRSSRQIEL